MLVCFVCFFMWLTVSSLSSYNIHLLFCCVFLLEYDWFLWCCFVVFSFFQEVSLSFISCYLSVCTYSASLAISFSLLFLILSSSPRIYTFTQSSMQTNTLPPSFIDTYSLRYLSDVKTCALSPIHLSFGRFIWLPSFSILRVSYNWHCVGVHRFDEISTAEFDFEKLSCSSETRFLYFFLHLRLFDGICFQFFRILVIFCPSVLMYFI